MTISGVFFFSFPWDRGIELGGKEGILGMHGIGTKGHFMEWMDLIDWDTLYRVKIGIL